MNFLCHAIPYLDQPTIAVATGIPDWLSVVDRKIRARAKLAALHLDSDDKFLSSVAQGIINHHDDDRWFHGGEAFVQTNLELAVELRDQLPGDMGFRPTFVGHILIEMLLDRFWLESDLAIAERYYDLVSRCDLPRLQESINLITGKPSTRIVEVVGRFAKSRFLFDYLDDRQLLFRLNQVMNRVKLEPLPNSLLNWLPGVRDKVTARRDRMLTPQGSTSPFPGVGAP